MERTKKPQLIKENRNALAKNLIDRMEAADKDIRTIMAKATEEGRALMNEKEKKDVGYLQLRIDQLNISYRLIHNTNWVADMQDREIPILKEALEKGGLSDIQKNAYSLQLMAFEFGKKCKTCHGHGYRGENISTGEYAICYCVLKYIGVYKKL